MVENIVTATDRLFHSVGDGSEMARQARILAVASSQLVSVLKTQAEQHPETDQQRRLLTAAKALADATTKLVEAAKVSARGREGLRWLRWSWERRGRGIKQM